MNGKLLKLLTVFFCCPFAFLSCGMDVVYYIYPSTVTYNVPVITSANYSDPASNYESAYFSFKTEEDSNDEYGSCTFLGTGVYYKIYNNYSKMNSDISTIASKISSTSEASAASYIIESLKYQPLACSGTNDSPLIKSQGMNRQVYIRLTNYNEETNPLFAARVLVGNGCEKGETAAGVQNLGRPLRAYGKNLNFDFGRKYTSGSNSGNYVVPESGDDDVSYSSASSSGVWYVALYAIGVARDESYTTIYSNALHLGAVGISQNYENN